jgi:TRAP-type transport system periplasmic protein
MKLKHLTTALATALALVTAPASAQEKTEWTMISPLTPSISYVPIYEEMIDAIETRSEGRLSISLLTFGQHPFEGGEIMTAVRDGAVQMGNTADAYVSAQEPAIAFMGLPFLFNDIAHAKRVYGELEDAYFGKILAEKYNSRLLLGFLISGAAIHADVPLDSLDALDGRKIRVFGKESGQMIELLGGTPVTVSFGELYTALQRGTINGALTGMLGAQASKIYEVVDNNTWWNWSYVLEFIMVNEDAFAALPEDVQQIVLEEGAKATQKVQALQDRLPAEVLVESIEKYGITSTGLDAETRELFRNTTKPVTEDWLATTGETGKMAYDVYLSVSPSAD